ncbi:sister chromatid cohesion protein PDS5 homolog A [Syzygium oleosum]|uniref:sister chromatid cohesion protein PDS5 homolog A n=1 Tax=Syzygium oleosum TaxID=219896 RepID=UPI0024B95746|nr:sister chromatid cohesion protein PDS5 homolog A [Syzygium oleosum]
MGQKLEQQLKELGSKLESPPPSKDALAKLLKQATTCLSELDQSPSASTLESLEPFFKAIVKPELLKHPDRDVKLLVAACVCEITRITAPNAPYDDDVLKDIFQLIVSTFSGLKDASGPSFGRRVIILETVAKYRSCVVMLDLECDDLVNEMFSTFFAVASDEHPESVLTSMQTIMTVLLEESEDIHEDLVLILLSVLGRNKNDFSGAARKLAMNVIESCEAKLEPGIKQLLVSLMSGDSKPLNNQIDYHEVICDVYQCAPQILSGVIPYLTGELLTDQLEVRLKAVKLVGDLFSIPGHAITEPFQPVFSEFLKRLTDRAVEIRMSVLEHVKNFLLSNPSRAESPQIIAALCDRLLDYDENVRKQVVTVICDVASNSPNSIPADAIKLVADRLRDKSPLVKKYTMEKLADIFRIHCMNSDVSVGGNEFDWIPGKILRCFYDKDFRSDTIESFLYGSLYPIEMSIREKVKYWVRFFLAFDKVEVKALERILEQKQRLQQEMQRYLSFRQMYQNGDPPEIQKKVQFCFKIMSRFFPDPAKAEENFQILDQLKDTNVWKILTCLLDPDTSFDQSRLYQDDMLKILGEKHRLYEFLGTLSVKCSYLLFSKEHVKEIILEVSTQKSAGNTPLISSCMNTLVLLARYSPLLLIGIEEELVNFIKDDNDTIKEGALHILAKAGGIIREQLATSSSSVDLILERLCLQGSRRQAKYAVHALAAITKDDGLKSLSVLYKRLVDMLEDKTQLPAVLQSLGCIAQTAMPVFETREDEITEFIKSKILMCSDKADENTESSWDDRSELCLMKIYGIKTLVKSYLPTKDAHLRPGIDGLLATLKNILLFGEMAEDVKSSSVDKAHMKLASAKAIIRLAKQWDEKIPVDIFHLTLRTSEIGFPKARTTFLSKIHQYIKDRVLDAKYACAFLFGIVGLKTSEFEEEKQNLADIIQTQYQLKARQLAMQSDTNSVTAYPEYILAYLVHALAHHSCPNVDECKDIKAYEDIYRLLYFFLSTLVNGEDDGKSEASPKKDKESVSVIISILQNIKCSEDSFASSKTKNAHAICDLGLSIMKRLTQADGSLQVIPASVSLPLSLYKLLETKEGDNSEANEGKTWLADESILAHFESLKLETCSSVLSENPEEEDSKVDEQDGNELPLKKMVKHMKSRGKKGRKARKSKTSEIRKPENDIDVLNMVRQINLDTMDMSAKLDSANGHEHPHTKGAKSQLRYQNGEKSEGSDATPSPIPKRKRSSSAHGAVKSPKKNAKESESKASLIDSDLLVSSFRKRRSSPTRHSVKGSDRDPTDDAHEGGEVLDDDLKLETDKASTNDVKSPEGSSKKRKRKSIAGLARCTLKDIGDLEDLIGCKIKVWWPMDKRFYQGTIKSYDTEKKKHVVLYEDGDVEILNLEKERWELMDKGRKSAKKLKSSKGSSAKKVSSSQKEKVTSSSKKIKEMVKIVKGKRTPKKKPNPRSTSETAFGDAEGKGVSDLSDADPTTSKDYVESGNSEDPDAEDVDGKQIQRDESDTEMRSFSKRKWVKDMEGSHSSADARDEEEERSDMDSLRAEDQESDEEEGPPAKRVPKGKELETKTAGSKSKSKKKSGSKSSKASMVAQMEIPDDEPLKLWKSRVGKSSSRRVG